MQEHFVTSLDGRELRFQGILILEQQSPIEIPDEFQRTLELRLFSLEGGGFVPTIVYLTNHPEENEVRSFEQVDTMKDVECFFLVFEPNEILGDGRGLSRLELEQRSVAYQRLSKQLETTIFPFTDEIMELAEAKGCSDKPEPKKKSLWSL